MVEKSLPAQAKDFTTRRTKAVLGLSVAITLLRMAISFPCKRMGPSFWPIPAKDSIIPEMKVEVG